MKKQFPVPSLPFTSRNVTHNDNEKSHTLRRSILVNTKKNSLFPRPPPRQRHTLWKPYTYTHTKNQTTEKYVFHLLRLASVARWLFFRLPLLSPSRSARRSPPRKLSRRFSSSGELTIDTPT